MRLLCENIDDFIEGHKFNYSVNDHEYEIGQTITLYNDHKEHDFRVAYIYKFKEHTVLHLVEAGRYNRELITSHYAGTNPND